MTHEAMMVRVGIVEDVPLILPWLESDSIEHGTGFWRHRDMIRKAVGVGDLYVVTVGPSVVGFQLGEKKIDLIQVQWSWRNRGVALLLIEATCQRAAAAGNNLLFVSALDEAYWSRRGFSEWAGDVPGGGTPMSLHIPTWERQQRELQAKAVIV